MDGLYLKLTVW